MINVLAVLVKNTKNVVELNKYFNKKNGYEILWPFFIIPCLFFTLLYILKNLYFLTEIMKSKLLLLSVILTTLPLLS